MEKTTVLSPQKEDRRLHGVALFAVLTALLFTLFLEALDNTIVGPVLPRIVNQFQGFDRYTWVVTAYLLTSTAMIPIVGKLSDQFGRKWFLLIGGAVFLLGSALTGVAQSMNQLILFRAVQGFGAGMGITLVATVIGDIFPPVERAKWQTSVNIVYALANLVGPGFGGWIAEHGPIIGSLITASSRWRWIFYLNLPLGVIAVVTLIIALPANTSEHSNLAGWEAARRIDVGGAFLCIVATVCLLLGLTWGSNQIYAWNSPQVIGILVVAGVLSGLFLLFEHHAAEAILPLKLFRNRIFAADAALSLLVYMILLGLAIYLPLFLQAVLGISVTNAGAMMTPFLLSITIGATLAGMLVAIRKRYQLIVIFGTLIMALGTFLLAQMTLTTGLLEAVIYMVIAGLGIGSIFSVLYLAAQNTLPPSQLGVASATVRYLGQLGSILGVALVGAVVSQSLTPDLVRQLPTIGGRPLVEALRLSLALAIQHGFLVILLLCGAALLAACFLKDVPAA